MNIDLLIAHAAQLITVASPGGPRRGAAMRELGAIRDGALAIAEGRIVAVGTTAELQALAADAAQMIDASGKAVLPGFVDAHTHPVFAGIRANEFEQRASGATYREILHLYGRECCCGA